MKEYFTKKTIVLEGKESILLSSAKKERYLRFSIYVFTDNNFLLSL